jgi:hypothetical protein
MKKSFIEQKIEAWAHDGGLFPLHLTDPENGDRLWWFFTDDELISPRDGLCDESVIVFFSGQHHLTPEERKEFDREQS